MDSTLIQNSLKIRNRNRITSVVFLIIVLALAYFLALQPLARDLRAEYSEVQATAVEQGTVSVLEGGRRSKHWVDRRAVTLEFTLGGVTQRERVRSESIQVGSTHTVWVEDDGTRLEVFTEKKTGPHWGLWVGSIIGVLIAVGILLGIVASARASRRIKELNPGVNTPLAELEVFDIRSKLANEKRKAAPHNVRVQVFGRVVHSSSTDIAVGAEYVLQNLQVEMPPGQLSRISVVPVKPGASIGEMFVAATGTQDWWVSRMGLREHTVEFKA